MLGEMLQADGARRTKGRCPLRYLLILYHRQSTIALAAGCRGCSGGCYDSRSGEKRAAALIGFFRRFLMRKLHTDSALCTITNAVKAIYATPHINRMSYRVDAFSFAVFRAFLATIAFVGINSERHDGSAADDAQERAYRTNRIAPKSAAEQRHRKDDEHQRGYCNICCPCIVRTGDGADCFAIQTVRL